MPKPPPTLPEVLDTVRAYCAANWIGLTPERLTVTFLYGAPAFEAPLVGIGPAATQPPGEGVAEVDADERYSQCIGDILGVLHAARHPMTGTRIMDALARANKTWSKRTVENYLAEMVRDGTLDNPKGVKPLGYRLPEWEQSGDSAGDGPRRT